MWVVTYEEVERVAGARDLPHGTQAAHLYDCGEEQREETSEHDEHLDGVRPQHRLHAALQSRGNLMLNHVTHTHT